MVRSKSCASSRLSEYSNAPLHVSGGVLFSTSCSIALDHSRKSTIDRHLKSQLHIQKHAAGPPLKRQKTMDDIASSTVSSSTEMHQDLVKCFVGMNIPRHQLDECFSNWDPRIIWDPRRDFEGSARYQGLDHVLLVNLNV